MPMSDFNMTFRQPTTYAVWSLDVWGNDEEGFEVNDRCKVGELVVPAGCFTGRDFLDMLEDGGFLKSGSADVGEIDGDSDFCLYVQDSTNQRPWLQLEAEERSSDTIIA